MRYGKICVINWAISRKRMTEKAIGPGRSSTRKVCLEEQAMTVLSVTECWPVPSGLRADSPMDWLTAFMHRFS